MTTTEVEVLAAAEATAVEMVTDMATGIATGMVTEMAMGMVMDVVTEMAMAMAMEMATAMAMEMATTTMDLVVEAEVEEGPQPVVAEEVVEGVGAEAAVGAAVVEMFLHRLHASCRY
jgi:hypothetical protein